MTTHRNTALLRLPLVAGAGILVLGGDLCSHSRKENQP
jgi:hypothetical protein